MSKFHLDELNEIDRDLLALTRAEQDNMLARTIEWAKINSGSWNKAGLDQMVPLVAAALGSLDADVQAHPSKPIEKVNQAGEKISHPTGPVLTATARPDAHLQIVMTGHYDTVFPPGTFESIDDIGNGKLRGPGLTDMKGGINVMIEALRAFETTALKDRIGYKIVLSPDEEIGNFASVDFIREAASKAHIGLTFEPAMETGELAGARKGSAIYDAVFRGKASHAGRAPLEGRSAIFAAAELITKIEALNDPNATTTYNVGAIDGGGAVNVVPDLAIVKFGVRAQDQADADHADKTLHAMFNDVLKRDGISGELIGGFYRPPKPKNNAQKALITAVTETGKAIGLDLRFKDTGGVCEGNNVFAAGTPNIDTLGVRGGGIHSDQEYLVIESLSERAGLAALILNRIADGRINAEAIKKMMKED